MLQAARNHCSDLLHTADPAAWRVIQGESLGAEHQIGTSWVNCTDYETRAGFQGKGHKGIWGDKEIELLAGCAQGS